MIILIDGAYEGKNEGQARNVPSTGKSSNSSSSSNCAATGFCELASSGLLVSFVSETMAFVVGGLLCDVPDIVIRGFWLVVLELRLYTSVAMRVRVKV